MDAETKILLDNMLANGWRKDDDGTSNFTLAYISIGGQLVVLHADGKMDRYRLEKI